MQTDSKQTEGAVDVGSNRLLGITRERKEKTLVSKCCLATPRVYEVEPDETLKWECLACNKDCELTEI